MASGFITDLFTKIDRPIKKTEKICKRLLHPKSITKKTVPTYAANALPNGRSLNIISYFQFSITKGMGKL